MRNGDLGYSLQTAVWNSQHIEALVTSRHARARRGRPRGGLCADGQSNCPISALFSQNSHGGVRSDQRHTLHGGRRKRTLHPRGGHIPSRTGAGLTCGLSAEQARGSTAPSARALLCGSSAPTRYRLGRALAPKGLVLNKREGGNQKAAEIRPPHRTNTQPMAPNRRSPAAPLNSACRPSAGQTAALRLLQPHQTQLTQPWPWSSLITKR